MNKGIKEKTALTDELGYIYQANNGEYYKSHKESPDYNPALNALKELYKDVPYYKDIYEENPFMKLIK